MNHPSQVLPDPPVILSIQQHNRGQGHATGKIPASFDGTLPRRRHDDQIYGPFANEARLFVQCQLTRTAG
ncbi:MAG: hypothetical protein U0361_21135 [Nitrospiraceae bacterium]